MATPPTGAYLWLSSQRALREASPALSRLLLIAARSQHTALPERAAQHSCAACFMLIVPGVSGTVRTRRLWRQPRSRTGARQRKLCVKCIHCGHVNSFLTAAPPSARATIAAAPLPPAQPSSKKKRRPVQQQPAANASKKPRRSQAAPVALAPPAADDGLFGFDFVPLA